MYVFALVASFPLEAGIQFTRASSKKQRLILTPIAFSSSRNRHSDLLSPRDVIKIPREKRDKERKTGVKKESDFLCVFVVKEDENTKSA